MTEERQSDADKSAKPYVEQSKSTQTRWKSRLDGFQALRKAFRKDSPEEILELCGKTRDKHLFISKYPANTKDSYIIKKDSESAYIIQRTRRYFEEAINPIRRRGNTLLVVAIVLLTAGVGIVVFGWRSLLTDPKPMDHANIYDFIIRLVQILSKAGLLLIVAKLLFAIGKASLHEAIKNYERRHAIRFGVLYIELTGKDWKFEELKEAIQWNREGSSAFRDIDLRHVSATTLNALLSRLNDLTETATTAAAQKAGESIGANVVKDA